MNKGENQGENGFILMVEYPVLHLCPTCTSSLSQAHLSVLLGLGIGLNTYETSQHYCVLEVTPSKVVHV